MWLPDLIARRFRHFNMVGFPFKKPLSACRETHRSHFSYRRKPLSRRPAQEAADVVHVVPEFIEREVVEEFIDAVGDVPHDPRGDTPASARRRLIDARPRCGVAPASRATRSGARAPGAARTCWCGSGPAGAAATIANRASIERRLSAGTARSRRTGFTCLLWTWRCGVPEGASACSSAQRRALPHSTL